MFLIVTYDIATDKRDYTPLYDAIKGAPASTWWHYLDATWLVKTTETPNSMSTRLLPLINAVDDSILITKVDLSVRAGWLPKKAWDWIKTNV